MKSRDMGARAGVILSCLIAGLIFMGYEAPVASAQVLYGSIVGTVTDPTRAVVANATVTVKNTSTGLSRQVSADETGYYTIQNLPQGTYDLSVSSSGFRPIAQKGVKGILLSPTLQFNYGPIYRAK